MPVLSAPGDRNRSARRGSTILTSIVVLTVVLLLVLLMLPPLEISRGEARRTQCKHMLKQIALALHDYHDEHGVFPPAYLVDAEGQRLHSWRTLLLPYLDQKPLYKQIDLTRQWNDPVNVKAHEAVSMTFDCPAAEIPRDYTTYLAVLGDHSCLQPTTPRKLSEITDGANTTLMIVEVPPDRAVHWMEPRDLEETEFLAWDKETKYSHEAGFHAAFADGHVRFLPASLPAQDRRAMVSINRQDHWDD